MDKQRVVMQICLIVSLSGLCTLTGCKVGPDYTRPEYIGPDHWHQTAVEGLAEGTADFETWWMVFDDPILTQLIDQAHAENLTLKKAYASVMEAQAQLGVASGQYWPEVDAIGSYERARVSENGLMAPATGRPDQTNLHTLGVDATWEIDVFGRISRSVEAAQASMQASVENYRDVLVTLYSQVALNYIELRALQTRIHYAQANVEAQITTLKLTNDRLDAGLVPKLDVSQAQLNLSSTESVIPRLRQLETQTIHRLSVLVGKPPSELYDKLSPDDDIPDVPDTVTATLPAELLRQRPDIRRAERILAAQTADVGVATAALYPSFSLSGTFALQAQMLDDVGDRDSRTWGFGPAMRWNIFDGNRIRSQVKVQEAQTMQALADYEQTVLGALQDVEDSMVAFTEEKKRLQSLQQAVESAEESVILVSDLYKNGLTDFQNVLDMQRSLTTQQDNLATSQGQVAQNLVLIYKSLGGGWKPEQTPAEETQQ